MANGFMNPYGTSVPFLFGEDPASQEAQRSFGEAAGKVGEFILGSGEPMKVEGQPVATGEPFFGLLGPTGVTQLGGLRQLSRFRPRATQATDAPMLPVLRQGQAPAVPGGRPPAARPTGTIVPSLPAVRPTGTIVPSAPAAPTSNLLRDLAATGAAIGGTAALVNQFSGDKQNETAPTLPQEVAQTAPQPMLTTVPGLEGGFGGMSLSEFLAPDRAEREAEREAARSAFEEASREREARLEQEERIRAAQRTGSKAAIDAAQAQVFGQSQGILSQLEPTQLTYLMGQLGYDISPKDARPTAPTTPTDTDTSEVSIQEFKTQEEAEAAGLPIGTRVKIGGRDAIIT